MTKTTKSSHDTIPSPVWLLIPLAVVFIALAGTLITSSSRANTQEEIRNQDGSAAALTSQALAQASTKAGLSYKNFDTAAAGPATAVWLQSAPETVQTATVTTSGGVTTLTVNTARATCQMTLLADGVGTPASEPTCKADG